MPSTRDDIKQKAEEITDLVADMYAINTDSAYYLIIQIFSVLSERKFAEVPENHHVHIPSPWRRILLLAPATA